MFKLNRNLHSNVLRVKEDLQLKTFKDEIKFWDTPWRSAMHCLAGSVVACPKVTPPPLSMRFFLSFHLEFMFYYLQVHWYARARRRAGKDRKMSNRKEVVFEDLVNVLLVCDTHFFRFLGK